MAQAAYIKGFGYYAPERILDNAEISTMVDTSDEWIRTRTGIEQRRIVAHGQPCSDMLARASVQALEASGVSPEEITHIITGTVTGDDRFPSTATHLQERLGISGMAFDLQAACSGFLYSLYVAQGILALEPESRILVTAGEVASIILNWTDRDTCVLFGDGGGAAVLSTDDKAPDRNLPLTANARVEGLLCDADGKLGKLLYGHGGGSSHPYKLGDTVGPECFTSMNGRELFRHAVRNMCSICEKLLDKLGLGLKDIDLVIPHQANLRIISAVAERLGVPEEKLFINVQKYGNTSAGSIPIAMGEAIEQGRLKPGMRVLLTTFGAGLTWSAAILKF
ncbi:MAG: ketoacyl-ACP synthase III [Desulfovibrionaceae bacterium]|nr:ketoacyl-ACP synthase III [Desulfovibrionaceae bacterium]